MDRTRSSYGRGDGFGGHQEKTDIPNDRCHTQAIESCSLLIDLASYVSIWLHFYAFICNIVIEHLLCTRDKILHGWVIVELESKWESDCAGQVWQMCGSQAGRKQLCENLRAFRNVSCWEEVIWRKVNAFATGGKRQAQHTLCHTEQFSKPPSPTPLVYIVIP